MAGVSLVAWPLFLIGPAARHRATRYCSLLGVVVGGMAGFHVARTEGSICPVISPSSWSERSEPGLGPKVLDTSVTSTNGSCKWHAVVSSPACWYRSPSSTSCRDSRTTPRGQAGAHSGTGLDVLHPTQGHCRSRSSPMTRSASASGREARPDLSSAEGLPCDPGPAPRRCRRARGCERAQSACVGQAIAARRDRRVVDVHLASRQRGGQTVGHLADGTMVVQRADHLIGDTLIVQVTS